VHWLQNGERHSRHQHHPFDSQLTLVVEQRFELGMGDRELHEVGYTGTAGGCNDTMPHLRLARVHGWPNVDDDSCPIHGSGEIVAVKQISDHGLSGAEHGECFDINANVEGPHLVSGTRQRPDDGPAGPSVRRGYENHLAVPSSIDSS